VLCTRDERVASLAEYTHGTHGVLSGSFQTGEETTDQVGGHEDLGQLVVVLVMDEWKRKYSNEDTLTGALPWFYENFDPEGYSVWRVDFKYNDELTQVKRRLGQLVQGVFGLGLGGNDGLIVVIVSGGLLGSLLLLGSGGSIGLGLVSLGLVGLAFLLGCLVLRSGLNVLDFTEDGCELASTLPLEPRSPTLSDTSRRKASL
jgi:hypothetical protein